MPASAPRRSLLQALLGALLAGLLLAASGAGSGAATVAAPSPLVRAVVAYEGAAPSLPGLQVLHSLPAVGALVVEGTPAALSAASTAAGVRGVAADAAIELAGTVAPKPAVAASHGLGGAAGRSGAGRGVRVAVVDTGVSDTPALNRASGRLVDAVDTSTTPNRGALTDGYGHGTFMASLIAGGPVDGGSAVGVAPGATVLVVRVAEQDGSTRLSQVVRGLDWVARHARSVDVANLSFSHTRPGESYGADPLTHAVERVRDAGVTVVVSAGNDPSVVGDPGFTPRVLTVGAADLSSSTPSVAAFSGSAVVAGVAKPDVVASGVGVLGVLPPASRIALDHPDARESTHLWRGNGTSQAAAVTSGAVALLLAERPTATPAEVKADFRAAAKPLPGKRDGAGLLRLVRHAAPGAPADPSAGPGRGRPGGQGGFDANSWSANSWSANSWSANSWSANSWSATWGAER